MTGESSYSRMTFPGSFAHLFSDMFNCPNLPLLAGADRGEQHFREYLCEAGGKGI
jgi:hypothetical protein